MPEHKVRRLRQVAWVVLAVCALAVLGRMAKDPDRWFWDFETYYHAAQVWAEGGNPYDLDELARHSDGRVTHRFLYPLAAMPLLRTFSLLPFETARIAWLALKLLLLVGLVRLWRVSLLRDVDPLLIGFVLVLGFDAALIWELESGNITIIEQVLLWGGLTCFLRRRYALFATLIVAAALIKLTLIAFLGLLIFAPGNRRGRIAAGAVALLVFGALAAGPFLARPDLHQTFAENLSGLREIHPLNPSALAIIDHVGGSLLGPLASTPDRRLALWALYAVALVAVSWRTLRRVIAGGDQMLLVAVAVILYCLLAPRLKIYSYVMLMPASLLLWLRVLRGTDVGVLFAALVCMPGIRHLPGQLGIVAGYSSYLVNLALWLIVVYATWDDDRTDWLTATATPREGACGGTLRS